MKYKSIITVAILSAALAASCTKTGTDRFRGYYSFKTGGYVDIAGKTYDGERDTTFVRYIANENGQLRILPAEGDKVKVTYSVTGGAPIVFDGIADGDNLKILPQTRSFSIYSNPGAAGASVTRMLSMSGSGYRYENTIIMDLTLEGEYSSLGLEGTIKDSHVNCIAVENE